MHVPNFEGVSGSGGRGDGDNSIQFINFGRVGDKSCKNGYKKWGRGRWKGGLQPYFDFCPTVFNKNATFPYIFNTGLPIHRTEKTAFWAISSIRICKVS